MAAAINCITDPGPIQERIMRQSGELMFDVGANAGFLSRMLAPQFTRIVAFEPCAESYSQLADRAPDNVTCVPMAVSNATGTVNLGVTTITAQFGELITSSNTASWDHWGLGLGQRTVDSVTLDDAAARYGVPDFVKIDTEGHEGRIMHAAETLLEAHPTWMIEIHANPDGEFIHTLLEEYGYCPEVIRGDHYEAGSPIWFDHYWIAA